MASIRPITGKKGTTYQIIVTHGFKSDGSQNRKYKTVHPPSGLNDNQLKQYLSAEAYKYEQEVIQGFVADGRQTFSQYADYVIELKERSGIKHRTIVRYRELLARIIPAIGHIKLQELHPQHLNKLYRYLGEKGIRGHAYKAKAKMDISALMSEKKLTRAALALACMVSASTITKTCKGETIDIKTAETIGTTLGVPVDNLFILINNNKPLSNKTIYEYHQLIHTILAQAEKEMLVQFNAADKATPPKCEKKEANSFTSEELRQIVKCSNEEPIKWRLAIHLFITTGCRRGEIAGLKWDRIDWERDEITIDTTLLYSADRGVYEDTTKTKTTRYITLPVETMRLLSEYKAWYDELRVHNGNRWIESGYVFVQDNGERMHPDSFTDWLNKFSKRYGIKNVHPHKFRHTLARLLLEEHIDFNTISKILGHKTVSTTTDIYSHYCNREQARGAVANAIYKDD